jgi:hypothetical protein
MGKEKVCGCCEISLPIENFRIRKDSEKYTWYESNCRGCENLRAEEYRNQPGYYERRKKYKAAKAGNIKFHIQERISQWRTKTLGSDLDTDYLLEIYNNQNGLCYYSQKEMIVGAQRGSAKPDSLSLDRLTPSKGYVKGNVVWCTYLTNTMKQDMTEDEFYIFMQNILKVKDGK